ADEAGAPASAAKPKRPRWGPWATLGWVVPIGLVMVISQTLSVILYWQWLRATHPGQRIEIFDLRMDGGALAFSLTASTPFLLGFLAYVIHLSRVPLKEYLALKLPLWREIRLGVGVLAAVL